jgi:hypothetical protein
MHGLMGGGWKRGATTVDAKDPGGETLGVSAKTYRRATPPRQSSTLHGRFYRSRLTPLLQRINTYLMRWAGKKYKRLRSYRRFQKWWFGLIDREPELFQHWRWVHTFAGLR